jgi:hypothetical protein
MNELVDADNIQRSLIRMGTHGRNDDPTGACNSIPDIHEPTPPRPTLPSGHIVDWKNTLQTFDIRSFVFMERSDYVHQSGDGRRNRGNGSSSRGEQHS